MSGYITYINYTTGSNKGQTKQGDLYNNPFQLKNVDSEYTADAVTETFATGQTVLGWTPCIKNVFKKADGTVLGDFKVVQSGGTYYGTFAAGSETTGTLASATYVDGTGATATVTLAANDKIYYKYDNVVIPQNDLPIINAEMKAIPLVAKARRVAVYYSQIAAFEAFTDYGAKLGDLLQEQAVGRLSFEIDTEIVELLKSTAEQEDAQILSDLTFSKTLPVGVFSC